MIVVLVVLLLITSGCAGASQQLTPGDLADPLAALQGTWDGTLEDLRGGRTYPVMVIVERAPGQGGGAASRVLYGTPRLGLGLVEHEIEPVGARIVLRFRNAYGSAEVTLLDRDHLVGPWRAAAHSNPASGKLDEMRLQRVRSTGSAPNSLHAITGTWVGRVGLTADQVMINVDFQGGASRVMFGNPGSGLTIIQHRLEASPDGALLSFDHGSHQARLVLVGVDRLEGTWQAVVDGVPRSPKYPARLRRVQ